MCAGSPTLAGIGFQSPWKFTSLAEASTNPASAPLTIEIDLGTGTGAGMCTFPPAKTPSCGIRFSTGSTGTHDLSTIFTKPAPWCTGWGSWGDSNYAADFTFGGAEVAAQSYEIRRNAAGVQNIVFNGSPVVGTGGTLSWDPDQLTFLTFHHGYLWDNNTDGHASPSPPDPNNPLFGVVWAELQCGAGASIKCLPPDHTYAPASPTLPTSLPTDSIGITHLADLLKDYPTLEDRRSKVPPPPLPGPACAVNSAGEGSTLFYGRFTNSRNAKSPVTLDFSWEVSWGHCVVISGMCPPGSEAATQSDCNNRLILGLTESGSVWHLKPLGATPATPPSAILTKYTAPSLIPFSDPTDPATITGNLSQLALFPQGQWGATSLLGAVPPGMVFNSLPLPYSASAPQHVSDPGTLISPNTFFHTPPGDSATQDTISPAVGQPGALAAAAYYGVVFGTPLLVDKDACSTFSASTCTSPRCTVDATQACVDSTVPPYISGNPLNQLPSYVLFQETTTSFPDIVFVFSDQQQYELNRKVVMADSLLESASSLLRAKHDSETAPGWGPEKPTDNARTPAYVPCSAAVTTACTTVAPGFSSSVPLAGPPGNVPKLGPAAVRSIDLPWSIQTQDPSRWQEPLHVYPAEADQRGGGSIVIQGVPIAEINPENSAVGSAVWVQGTTTITCWGGASFGFDAAGTAIMLESPVFGRVKYFYMAGGVSRKRNPDESPATCAAWGKDETGATCKAHSRGCVWHSGTCSGPGLCPEAGAATDPETACKASKDGCTWTPGTCTCVPRGGVGGWTCGPSPEIPLPWCAKTPGSPTPCTPAPGPGPVPGPGLFGDCCGTFRTDGPFTTEHDVRCASDTQGKAACGSLATACGISSVACAAAWPIAHAGGECRKDPC